MGIGNSRQRYGQRPRKRSLSPRRRYSRRNYLRRRSSQITETIFPSVTLPISYQPLYGSYYGNGQFPIYAPLQPIPPVLPINYSAPLQVPPQYMMAQPQRVAQPMSAPYMAPLPPPPHSSPMSMPYVQQPQIQPAYNNIGGIPASMPVNIPVAIGPYPASYPSPPGRLITDWTAGGQISPGFLGPPI